jgi:hypothetical protein
MKTQAFFIHAKKDRMRLKRKDFSRPALKSQNLTDYQIIKE